MSYNEKKRGVIAFLYFYSNRFIFSKKCVKVNIVKFIQRRTKQWLMNLFHGLRYILGIFYYSVAWLIFDDQICPSTDRLVYGGEGGSFEERGVQLSLSACLINAIIYRDSYDIKRNNNQYQRRFYCLRRIRVKYCSSRISIVMQKIDYYYYYL